MNKSKFNEYLIILIMMILFNVSCNEYKDEIKSTKIAKSFQDKFMKANSEPYQLDAFDSIFRMGPILLKFDKEWLLTNGKEKYIKIGVQNTISYSDDCDKEYELMSIKSKSFETTTLTLVPQERKNIKQEINVYSIYSQDTSIWIDFNCLVAVYIDKVNGSLGLELLDEKRLYFYHPKEKKWWGIHYMGSKSLNYLLFDDLYRLDNDIEDIDRKFKNIYDKDIVLSIISNRIMNLPSIEYFNSKLNKINEDSDLFCWYVEKEEPEKVDPKDDDE